MRIDPNHTFMLTDKSWPLALPLVDEQGQPIGVAQYVNYIEQNNIREIFYTFDGKRFKLVKKVVPSNEETSSDPDD